MTACWAVCRRRGWTGREDRGADTGLNVPTYADMVQAAFQEQWWGYAD